MTTTMKHVEALTEAVAILINKKLEASTVNEYVYEVLAGAQRHIQSELNVLVTRCRAEVAA